MTTRVSPTERIRAEIDELIAGAERGSLLEHFEDVARAAVRLVFQMALENEVTEFFGRERYTRGERDREGSRNGYSPMTIKTTAGEVTLQRPKTRGTEVAFASRLLGTGVTRTNALESLVIAGFVRGLSVRGVEASLVDALGPESTVSKSTVSRICEAIKDEFDTWRARDLSGVELDYFFADGSYFRMHPGSPACSSPVAASRRNRASATVPSRASNSHAVSATTGAATSSASAWRRNTSAQAAWRGSSASAAASQTPVSTRSRTRLRRRRRGDARRPRPAGSGRRSARCFPTAPSR